MRGIRIVLASNSLASYPQGGGHWSCFLQYLFGLNALGCDVFWLEVLESCGDGARDQQLISVFSKRFERYGFRNRFALLLYNQHLNEPKLEDCRVYGMGQRRFQEIARDADLLWNFACGLRQPLLLLFKRRVLIDGDPGHLQISALTCDMGIHDHQVFLTAGTNMHQPDSEVPTLGLKWRPFVQFVYMPMWKAASDPGMDAPFTSVTEWTWEELWFNDRVLSVSKRDAYLKYVTLPKRSGRLFQLAANIDVADETRDRDLLLSHGWRLVHPHSIARSPASYRRYIQASRAEFLCPKPIHRQLRTGWVSDRTAAYLARGRPVLSEDTGFSKHLPTGTGLLSFRDEAEALAGVAEIDANYEYHMRGARELAESYFDSRSCLRSMLSACA
jgi:hypothetical protein